jgi:hypothetical protein
VSNHDNNALPELPEPAAWAVREGIGDTLWHFSESRDNAQSQVGYKDSVEPLFTASQMHAYAELCGCNFAWDEALAWIKPDWRNPANYDGKSPVSAYPVNGWIPLSPRRAAGREEAVDKGPWKVGKDGRDVFSDDFTVDVALRISGDFHDDDHRMRYAEWLCSVLNRPTAPAGNEGEVKRIAREIELVLGPVVPSCSGCAYEWETALRLIRELRTLAKKPEEP